MQWLDEDGSGSVEIDELEVPSSVVYVMLSCSCFY
jgi:hypothetical protein